MFFIVCIYLGKHDSDFGGPIPLRVRKVMNFALLLRCSHFPLHAFECSLTILCSKTASA